MRILLIDDEPLLLKSYSRFMTRTGGHEVLTRESGEAALGLLAEDPCFDRIFCDLSMPGVSGVDVHQAICQFHPELLDRFAFMTGGGTDEDTEVYLQTCGAPILGKPIPLAEFEKLLAGPP